MTVLEKAIAIAKYPSAIDFIGEKNPTPRLALVPTVKSGDIGSLYKYMLKTMGKGNPLRYLHLMDDQIIAVYSRLFTNAEATSTIAPLAEESVPTKEEPESSITETGSTSATSDLIGTAEVKEEKTPTLQLNSQKQTSKATEVPADGATMKPEPEQVKISQTRRNTMSNINPTIAGAFGATGAIAPAAPTIPTTTPAPMSSVDLKNLQDKIEKQTDMRTKRSREIAIVSTIGVKLPAAMRRVDPNTAVGTLYNPSRANTGINQKSAVDQVKEKLNKLVPNFTKDVNCKSFEAWDKLPDAVKYNNCCTPKDVEKAKRMVGYYMQYLNPAQGADGQPIAAEDVPVLIPAKNSISLEHGFILSDNTIKSKEEMMGLLFTETVGVLMGVGGLDAAGNVIADHPGVTITSATKKAKDAATQLTTKKNMLVLKGINRNLFEVSYIYAQVSDKQEYAAFPIKDTEETGSDKALTVKVNALNPSTRQVEKYPVGNKKVGQAKTKTVNARAFIPVFALQSIMSGDINIGDLEGQTDVVKANKLHFTLMDKSIKSVNDCSQLQLLINSDAIKNNSQLLVDMLKSAGDSELAAELEQASAEADAAATAASIDAQ